MAKPVTLPTSPDDLTREGLLFLVRRLGCHTRRDLLAARLHELETAATAASNAWRASLPKAEAATCAYHDLLKDKASYTSRGERKLRAARDASEDADATQERLWRASQRAEAAVNDFWKSEDAPEAGA